MQLSLRRIPAFAFAVLLTGSAFSQNADVSADQLKAAIKIRQDRVKLLKDEIKQTDSRIESRLDLLVNTLKSITDSKDSRTKVARMKEETGKALVKSIQYYDQKRAALREEMRNPRLQLTPEEKTKMIAAFDARIEKRTNQILELNKSMPTSKEYERYNTVSNGWDTQYVRNKDYEQNRRMTSHSDTQRDAILKQLDTSIARLDRQSRTLKTQLSATTDPEQRKLLTAEITKTDNLILERRKQRVATLTPSATAAHEVGRNEAQDLDQAMKRASTELREEFTTLFQRYNTLLVELSSLHSAEAVLAAKSGR